jgi:hypothetical protein
MRRANPDRKALRPNHLVLKVPPMNMPAALADLRSALAPDLTLVPLTAADHAARARGDLSCAPRGPANDPIARLREVHHRAARVLAAGSSDAQAAALLGWGPDRVRAMRGSPAFQELLALYAEQRDTAVLDIQQRMELIALDTLGELHERLLTEPEKLSEGILLALFQTAADRAGHGVTAKSVQTHLVVGADADRLRAVAERVVVADDVRETLREPAVSPALSAPLRPELSGGSE